MCITLSGRKSRFYVSLHNRLKWLFFVTGLEPVQILGVEALDRVKRKVI
jgi:hypothetical protein